MRNVAVGVALLVLASCQASGFEGTQYGEPLTLKSVTSVAAILADPAAYVGERVLVSGTVVDVCEKQGCWLELEADGGAIRVKVDDGVIVFPLSARGRRALAEGIVEERNLTFEQALAEAQHHAEEHGVEFDPTTVTGPKTTYRIKGIGALIAD
jgi:hypothetical protein